MSSSAFAWYNLILERERARVAVVAAKTNLYDLEKAYETSFVECETAKQKFEDEQKAARTR